MVHTIIEAIGFCLFLLGGASMNSGSLVLPSIMVIGGLAIVALTARRYEV